MRSIAIYGAGGLGAVVHDILRLARDMRPVAFLDSDPSRHGAIHEGLPILGGVDALRRLGALGIDGVFVAIGENAERVRIAGVTQAAGVKLVSAFHPLASVAPSAEIGEHVLIAARATVCVNARIGAHCLISAGAIVEHDNVLEEGVFLHPAVRLAGGVSVERLAHIRIGASVIPGRRIGRGADVGPGSVVIRDVVGGTRVFGAPATVEPADRPRFVPDTL